MERWKRIAKYGAVVLAVVGVIVFFTWAERWQSLRQSRQRGPLLFEGMPTWVSDALRMDLVALAGGAEFALRPGVAAELGQRLERSAWLKQVRVQQTPDAIVATAVWRQPIGLVESGRRRFYVDAEAVALEALDLPALPIVRIDGVARVPDVAWGHVVDREDLQAALALLQAIADMDRVMAAQAVQAGQEPQRSVLFELERLDVSNFQGRVDDRRPHLVLVDRDGTRLVWGAELGTWGRYLEAPDEVKLARLFTYYHHDRPLRSGPPLPVLQLHLPEQDRPQPIHHF